MPSSVASVLSVVRSFFFLGLGIAATAAACSSANDSSIAVTKSCRSGTVSQSAVKPQKRPPL